MTDFKEELRRAKDAWTREHNLLSDRQLEIEDIYEASIEELTKAPLEILRAEYAEKTRDIIAGLQARCESLQVSLASATKRADVAEAKLGNMGEP
jgi:multidrug resistance efflux pump